MSLTQSLQALPPRQALALALMEKARRTKLRKERQTALASPSASSRQPDFLDVPSLVLNRAHPLSDLIYKRATYKVFWGGRGSAKSWGIAEALIRKAASAGLLRGNHTEAERLLEHLLNNGFTYTGDKLKREPERIKAHARLADGTPVYRR